MEHLGCIACGKAVETAVTNALDGMIEAWGSELLRAAGRHHNHIMTNAVMIFDKKLLQIIRSIV